MTDDEIWATYADNIQHDYKPVYNHIVIELLTHNFFGTMLSPYVKEAFAKYVWEQLDQYAVPYEVV